jgi:hypothetical protein
MLRRIAAASLVVAVVACIAAAWAARSLATTPFIASGAADVRVSEIAPGQRRITYAMPNPDDGWQSAVVRRLRLDGWGLAADRYQWGGTETITTLAVYTRTSRLWFLELRERAELRGDRSNAIITISYVVASQ